MFDSIEGKKVLKFGSVVLIVLAVFLSVHTIYALVLSANVDKNTPAMNVITVNGIGEKIVVPDIATFSFGAQMTGESVASAQKVVTDRINKALDILKSAGIGESDIKTTGYNINPHYEYNQVACTATFCPPGRQVLTGYDVTQTVEVKVRDTSKAGEILGKLGGAEITNLSGLSFTVDEKELVQAEARSLAIADARAKAKILAKDLGVRLGKVVNFNESYYPESYAREKLYGMGGDMGNVPAPSVQVPVGENSFISNISITYEIR